jgi:hypothetical protein
MILGSLKRLNGGKGNARRNKQQEKEIRKIVKEYKEMVKEGKKLHRGKHKFDYEGCRDLEDGEIRQVKRPMGSERTDIEEHAELYKRKVE